MHTWSVKRSAFGGPSLQKDIEAKLYLAFSNVDHIRPSEINDVVQYVVARTPSHQYQTMNFKAKATKIVANQTLPPSIVLNSASKEANVTVYYAEMTTTVILIVS